MSYYNGNIQTKLNYLTTVLTEIFCEINIFKTHKYLHCILEMIEFENTYLRGVAGMQERKMLNSHV
jgi:hypothetical protein